MTILMDNNRLGKSQPTWRRVGGAGLGAASALAMPHPHSRPAIPDPLLNFERKDLFLRRNW